MDVPSLMDCVEYFGLSVQFKGALYRMSIYGF